MQKTILLILSLLLMACEGDEMPLEFVFVIDVPHQVCAKKLIVDKENLVFEHVEDLPLIECDGNVSIAKDDFPPFKNWVKRAIKKVKQCEGTLKNLR